MYQFYAYSQGWGGGDRGIRYFYTTNTTIVLPQNPDIKKCIPKHSTQIHALSYNHHEYFPFLALIRSVDGH